MKFLENSTSWQHFLKYFPLIKELVGRDLKVRYRRSFLGYAWSLLNPLMMMFVQSIVFSYLFRSDIPNFLLYLICGNTLFTFFNESTNMGMHSILQNSALIKKVYIPKFIFPLSRVFSSFVTMTFSLAAIVLVILFTRSPIYWTILLFWIPLCFLFLFCCGMSLLLSALTVYFRDMEHLYGVLTLAWMYVTPLFWPVSILPDYILPLAKLNPLYQYITMFRGFVIYGEMPEPTAWLACFISSFGMLLIGLFSFRKLQRNFILYI